jgi:hypothetical protein
MLGTFNNGVPEDYFYKFVYGKVYTVSSFQGTHYQSAPQLPSFTPGAIAINSFLRRESKDAFWV